MAEQKDFDSELQSIAAKCQIPREWLKMSADGTAQILPSETATYSDIICIVGELKARKVPMKDGYIAKVR